MNMSRLILMPRLSCLNNAAHLNPIKFEAVVTMAPPLTVPCRGLKVPAKKAAGGKGKKGAAMVKPDLDVETDAHKVLATRNANNAHYTTIWLQLVSTVCGLNYRVDGDQEAVPLRPDSEYPDWLWTLDVRRPLPPLEDQDPNTKEYWLQVQRDMKRQRNRLMKIYNKK